MTGKIVASSAVGEESHDGAPANRGNGSSHMNTEDDISHAVARDPRLARMKERLDALGITQTEASRNAGLHGSTLGKIFREKVGAQKLANSSTMEALAEALGVSVDWILHGEEAPARYAQAVQMPKSDGAGYADVRELRKVAASHKADTVSQGTTAAIPVVGFAQAGIFQAMAGLARAQKIGEMNVDLHPGFSDLPHFAVHVRDDSMSQRRIWNGDTVICVPWDRAELDPRSGYLVLVERRAANGRLREWSVKEIETREQGIVLHSRSESQTFPPIEILNTEHDPVVEIIGLVVRVTHDAFQFQM